MYNLRTIVELRVFRMLLSVCVRERDFELLIFRFPFIFVVSVCCSFSVLICILYQNGERFLPEFEKIIKQARNAKKRKRSHKINEKKATTHLY